MLFKKFDNLKKISFSPELTYESLDSHVKHNLNEIMQFRKDPEGILTSDS